MKSAHLILIGERNPSYPSHAGIEAAIRLYQYETSKTVSYEWIATDRLQPETCAACLSKATGIWCAPGSPYASTEGALRGIRFARETGRAFLGTCGGFQHALMEFCANVLNRPAQHQELAQTDQNALIVKLACSLAETQARVVAAADNGYALMGGTPDSMEEFNCNYGLAPNFESWFAGSPLQFVARDEAGQVRAFRLQNHPYFAGTLFQPERLARQGKLHPIVRAFFSHL